MKFRVIAILLVFALMIAMVPAASAQDMCFGLSADDCALIESANANMETVTSFTQNFAFDFSATGLAAMDPTMTDITVSASGTGPFAFTGTGNVPAALQMTLTGSANTPDGPQSGGIQFLMVDDFFYLENPDAPGQWIGFDLNQAMEAAFAQAGLPFDPAALATGDMQGMESMVDPAMADQASALLAIPGFITYERLADESMMDQTMYPFSLTIDLTALFAAEEFNTTLEQIGEATGDPSVAMLGAFLPMLISEGTVNVSQWVGADDNYIHKLAVDVNATVDLSAMSADATEPIVLDIHFEVSLSGFNESYDIVAPEGAVIVDVAQMMGGQ